MKLSFTFNHGSFDKVTWKNQLHQNLLYARKEAARQFVLTAFYALPVWSGAARGTFLPLARVLQIAGMRGAIGPIRTRRKDSEHGIDAGKAHGLGGFSKTRYSHVFTFTQDLRHYVINENNSMNYSTPTPTPWETFEKGGDAWISWVDMHGIDVMPTWIFFLTREKTTI